jgi:hypothetical protein
VLAPPAPVSSKPGHRNAVWGPDIPDAEGGVPSDRRLLASLAERHSCSSAVPMAEAMYYYSGLCSSPRLVYRTSTETMPWTMPTGPKAYHQLKELRPVFGHKLNVVWTTDLGPKVCQLLDFQGVLWTSIDVVRFIYTPLAGPNLLEPASDLDPDVDVCGPLTPALGLSIAAKATPHAEGTGGIYLAEGGDSKKVLLVTARHILFPPDDGNLDYARTNTSIPRRNVLLLGTKAFDNFLDSIKIRIG